MVDDVDADGPDVPLFSKQEIAEAAQETIDQSKQFADGYRAGMAHGAEEMMTRTQRRRRRAQRWDRLDWKALRFGRSL